MKKKLLSLLVALAIGTLSYGQCWVQTWSDEFDGTSLDQTKWNYDLGNNNGWGNNELEYYTNSTNNVSVSNGQLSITAKYEPNYNGTGFNYTSGRILTQGKFSQTYGRYEARIKVPSGGGVWPAFWTLGENISTLGWPKCGEIDIMETQNSATKMWNTVHYAGRRDAHASKGTTWDYLAGLSNDFHIYAMEWDAQEIRWYFDGALKFTATKADITSAYYGAFDLNQFILLNVAVGGNFAGSGNVVSSQYPASMIVDYVRAYKLGTCNPVSYINITSPANNASFNTGASINVTADALIVNGSVSKVEFFSDNVSIGVATTSPYSINWNGATAGTHSLTAIVTDAQGGTITSSPVSISVVIPQSPFGGSPINLPGRIEAENYDLGGAGKAYNDLTAGNSGNIYRFDDVDIESTNDPDGGLYDVYGTQNGEWLEYTVNVATAGTYKVDVKLLSSTKKYNLKFELDGIALGTITFTSKKPNDGSTTWQTVSFNTPSITTGQKILKISVLDDSGVKLNYVDFTRISAKMASLISVDNASTMKALEVYPNPTNTSSSVRLNVSDASDAEYTVVNSMGVEISKGKLSSNLEGTVNLAGMEKGIYFVKVIANDKVYVEKLVKE